MLCNLNTSMPTEEAPTTTSVSGVSTKECSKCGSMKKSGKLSCCARGGAWYGNCGDAWDSNVDHTWLEGMQACTGSSLFSSKAQVLIRHEQLNATSEENGLQQKIIDFTDDRTASVGTAKCKGFCSLLKVAIFMSIVGIVLHMY